jgi:hypothetical protein
MDVVFSAKNPQNRVLVWQNQGAKIGEIRKARNFKREDRMPIILKYNYNYNQIFLIYF